MPFSSALTWRETAQSALAGMWWSEADASRSCIISTGIQNLAPCAMGAIYGWARRGSRKGSWGNRVRTCQA